MPLRPCASCSKRSYMASRSLAPSLCLIPLNLLHFFCTYMASNQVFSHHWGQLRLKDEMGLLSTRQFVTSNRESLCKRREKGWSHYSLSCPPPWSSRLYKSSAGIAGSRTAHLHQMRLSPGHHRRHATSPTVRLRAERLARSHGRSLATAPVSLHGSCQGPFLSPN